MSDLLLSPIVQIIVLGIAGIVVWHLQGRRRPNARLVVQIAFFLTMTAILIHAGVVPNRFEPSAANGNLLVAAKTLWWVHLAWATIGFVRMYLDFDGRPHEARLMQDLMIAAVYLGALLSILSFVFGIAIGTLLATSGVIAIILGLALQSTLNDVFSGLALTLGRPYAIGDWIMLADGTEGRVVENTWRSTQILTVANNIVVLPNSYLAKIGLTNISRPDETHQMSLRVRVAPTRSPAFIADAMKLALMGANGIVHDPPPLVALQGIDAVAVDADLLFSVRHIADRLSAQNEIVDLVHRQCRIDGLALAPSGSTTAFSEHSLALAGPAETLSGLLRANPIFAKLTGDEIERLEAGAISRRYQPGESLLDGGEAPALGIVGRGVAAVERAGEEALRLASGAVIGQIGQDVNRPRFNALTSLEIYRIDDETLTSLLSNRPGLRHELSRHLSSLALYSSAIDERKAHQRWHAAAFLRAIQSVFRR